jgi:type II secretory pathway component GspD/PulD (secretin)
VLVDARFIEVRASFLEEIGVQWSDIPTTDPSFPANAIFTGMSPESPIFVDSHYSGQPFQTFGIYDLDEHNGIRNEFGGKVTFTNPRVNPYGARLGTSTPWGQIFGGGAKFNFRFAETGGFQAEAILNAIKREEKGDLLMSPRVTMYNNQRAYVLFARQRGYVADYDVSGGTFDPIIKTVLTGTILDVKPTVSHDRRYITLELRPGTADRLDLSRIVRIGGSVDLPIQLPRLQLRSVRTTVTLPDGGTILLSGLMTETKHNVHNGIPVLSDLPIIGRLFGSDLKQDERMNLLIMVSVRLILFEEEERKL